MILSGQSHQTTLRMVLGMVESEARQMIPDGNKFKFVKATAFEEDGETVYEVHLESETDYVTIYLYADGSFKRTKLENEE